MFYARFPRYMKDGHIRLRPLRILDGPFMRHGFRKKEIQEANCLSKPISSAWFSVWWWLKINFAVSYCIEIDSKRVGFIGLYNLRLGKSSELTLMIFDESVRRLGLGSTAFDLLAQNLRKHSIVKKIVVRVKTENEASIFWRKLGFEEIGSMDGARDILMDLDIANSVEEDRHYDVTPEFRLLTSTHR